MSNPIKNNMIAYSGKVKILYQDAKGRYRVSRGSNEGKIALFTFLTYALQGTYAKDLAPRYLNGIYVDGNIEYSVFFQKVVLSKTPVRKDSKNTSDINGSVSDCVEYCFTVNPAVFNKAYPRINRLQLVNSKDEVCAEIDLDGSNSIDVGTGFSNILVYWTLTFMNATSIQEIESNSIVNLKLTGSTKNSYTRHISDTSPITLTWSVEGNLGKRKVYCDRQVKSGIQSGGNVSTCSYTYDWYPGSSVGNASTESISIDIGVGTDSNNLYPKQTITCEFGQYVYCGFSPNEISDISTLDLPTFIRKTQSNGNLSEATYEGATEDNPCYLYYLIPQSYIDRSKQKVVMTFPGLGDADIDSTPREIDLVFNQGDSPVKYWIYKITDNKQTGSLKILITVK